MFISPLPTWLATVSRGTPAHPLLLHTVHWLPSAASLPPSLPAARRLPLSPPAPTQGERPWPGEGAAATAAAAGAPSASASASPFSASLGPGPPPGWRSGAPSPHPPRRSLLPRPPSGPSAPRPLCHRPVSRPRLQRQPSSASVPTRCAKVPPRHCLAPGMVAAKCRLCWEGLAVNCSLMRAWWFFFFADLFRFFLLPQPTPEGK